jgi:lysophospholipid acyltransferase (LPLAT)-like uncharacterized protein
MKNFIKAIKKEILNTFQMVAGGALYVFSHIYNSSIKVKCLGYENVEEIKKQGKNVIFAFWHGAAYLPVWCLRKRNICVYTSIYRTGPDRPSSLKFFKRATWLKGFRLIGYRILDAARYGDTETRGVIRFIKEIRSGMDGIIAVDGPKGPRYKAKDGAAYLAGKTGAVIIPVGAVATRKRIRRNQWDHLVIPRPFSRGALVFGSPVEVPERADEVTIKATTFRLEEELRAAMRKAMAAAKRQVEPCVI